MRFSSGFVAAIVRVGLMRDDGKGVSLFRKYALLKKIKHIVKRRFFSFLFFVAPFVLSCDDPPDIMKTPFAIPPVSLIVTRTYTEGEIAPDKKPVMGQTLLLKKPNDAKDTIWKNLFTIKITLTPPTPLTEQYEGRWWINNVDTKKKWIPPTGTTTVEEEIVFDYSYFEHVMIDFGVSPSSTTKQEGTITVSLTIEKNYPEQKSIILFLGTTTLAYRPKDIWTWTDLQAMKLSPDGTYLQMKTIDLSEADISTENKYNFDPIGDNSIAFTGSFSNNGFLVKNLHIKREEEQYVGLFGKTGGNTTINAHLVDASITGKEYVGAIAGYFEGVSLKGKNTKSEDSSASIKGTKFVGGIAGSVSSSSREGDEVVVYGHNTVDVESTLLTSGDSLVGGLVGEAHARITGRNAGTITGKDKVGGLVGASHKTVIGYTTGAVQGSKDVGGLVGYASSNVFGYTRANVRGSENVGGILGFLKRDNEENDSTTITSTGYMRGEIQPSGSTSTGNKGYLVGSTSPPSDIIGYHEKDVYPHLVDAKNGQQITSLDNPLENFAELIAASSFFVPNLWSLKNGEWPALVDSTVDGFGSVFAPQPTDPTPTPQ